MITLPTLAAVKAFGWLLWGRATGSKTTQIATIALACLVGYGAWLKFVHDPKVARRTTQKIERKADAAVQKSVDAQRRVPLSDASRRVRERYCADC